MCQFFSGIAFRNGDIHYNPMTDSHEDLIFEKGLNDNAELNSVSRNWVRFEYTSEKLSDLSTYKLRIDESSVPSWCDDDFKNDLINKVIPIIKSMILCDVEKKILIGGCWILTGGSIIDRCVSSRIILMDKSSKVGEMWGSSNVGEMWESSKVGVMRGSSKVGVMRESSKVDEMWGSSNVGVMRGSSKIIKVENKNTNQLLKEKVSQLEQDLNDAKNKIEQLQNTIDSLNKGDD